MVIFYYFLYGTTHNGMHNLKKIVLSTCYLKGTISGVNTSIFHGLTIIFCILQLSLV